MPRYCSAPTVDDGQCTQKLGRRGRCPVHGDRGTGSVSAHDQGDAAASAAGDPLPGDASVWAREQTHAHMEGALLGVHVGDSLGATAEFKSRALAATLYPGSVDEVDIVGGGAFGWRPGDATDDTDLTLAVNDAYLTLGLEADSDAIVRHAADQMLAWRRRGPRDIGGATSRGLSRYGQTRDPYTSGVADESGQGNGSLMRTMPVALARADDPELRRHEAAAISGVTHGHPNCKDACIAYCDLAADLSTGRVQGPDAIDRRLEQLIDDDTLTPDVRAAIRRGMQLEHISDLPTAQDGSGWVLYSLTVSVWAVRERRPAPEVLLDVVKHGGDADTNGAIAGGLLGVRDGAGVWPDRWLQTIREGGPLRKGAAAFAR